MARRRYEALLLAYRDLLVIRNAAEASLRSGLTGAQCGLLVGVASSALTALEHLEEVQDGGPALPQRAPREVELFLVSVEQERQARAQAALEQENGDA